MTRVNIVQKTPNAFLNLQSYKTLKPTKPHLNRHLKRVYIIFWKSAFQHLQTSFKKKEEVFELVGRNSSFVKTESQTLEEVKRL